MSYDALLIVGFGGPEHPDHVMPFLENVTRGRGVPRERLLEVAEHYQHFGGVSPINQQVRDLIAVLEPELREHGVDLPVYWGNRNWDPLLPDALREMHEAGVKRVLALVLAGYSSYSSCRQYRENVYAACDSVGEGLFEVDKIRVFYNHPDFVGVNAEHTQAAIDAIPEERRDSVHLLFTAHSIPSSMAAGCDYERQLQEASRLVADELGIPEERWDLVYQSRSGPPQMPWLEPDVCDHLEALGQRGVKDTVILPIGFLSDHMEVLFDLDEEAAQKSDELGINMVRAKTVGTHPRFVAMLRKLVQERLSGEAPKEAVGKFGPNHDVCPVDCCPAPQRPVRPRA